MCSHYEAPAPQLVAETFGIDLYEQGKLDLWPGYIGPFIRRAEHVDVESPAALEALPGSFGLIPSWSKDTKIARKTYNARSETVAEKPSFRTAWRQAQHCIIPAMAIYEPDWRTGKAIPTRITRADGELLGIAGLWEQWRDPGTGAILHSYTMLTINADDHSFMRNYHKPQDEKRMVVILPRGLYSDWLNAPASHSAEFMRQYPADRMSVVM
ncbi:SOS response-associated peptidase [Pseudomonas sp. F1002]|uniref:SOS response-associated peptidase n=1 Tax=Pseudomonas sp. F1002 TaxID=2738821 RepID=UPI0015A014F6|nr:SOS response-associated peptidase [Pseudomonas sp. F1002]NWB63543.1 SOS response-associated peptidase [Pseudomonas sp. F1002]